jgi:hypothetical protein
MDEFDKVPDEPHDSEANSDGLAQLDVFCEDKDNTTRQPDLILFSSGIAELRTREQKLTFSRGFRTPVDELYHTLH